MKSKSRKNLLLIAALASLTAVRAQAGYNVYPPFTQENYTFFEDSDNEVNARNCSSPQQQICVRASYLPNGVSLAKNEAGIPMLTQGIFFSSSMWKHSVSYNMTLEPNFQNSSTAVVQAKKDLARKYNVNEANVDISPVQVGAIQFIVRKTFGSGLSGDSADQVSTPPVSSAANASPSPTATPNPAAAPASPAPTSLTGNLPLISKPNPAPTQDSPEELGRKISLSTTFTNTLVPRWTGDFHNLSSRFSVNIQGALWNLEPGLQNMVLNKAGNGIIGQISFNFPVRATVFEGQISCSIRQFQDTFRTTLKSWHITRVTNGHGSTEVFNNDERNAVRASLNVQDFCDVKTFLDSTHVTSSALAARQAQLFDLLFNAAFQKIGGSSAPATVGGTDEKYTYLEQMSSMDANGSIKLHFQENQVFNLSSDLDFIAGGVTTDNLSPSYKYICEHFERFNRTTQRCEQMCDPTAEIYLPSDPRANHEGCINISSEIHTGSNSRN